MMLEQIVIGLKSGALHARINPENGQLWSLRRDGVEYLHPGGKPDAAAGEKRGWGHSEIVMFPFIGPVKEYAVAGQAYALSQHGTARHLPFVLAEASDERLLLQQRYHGGPISNTKFKPGSDEHEFLSWLPYELSKHYAIRDNGLDATFVIRNTSDTTMPYAFGWHPAFRIDEDAEVSVDGELVSLEQIRAAGNDAVKRQAAGAVLRTGNRTISLRSDTGYLMLWSPPESSLLCIEPVTRRQGSDDLMCELAPGREKRYGVEIRIA